MVKKDLKKYIIDQLDELKIEDIVIADVSKTSSIADFVIIGSGRSGKHIESSMEILKANLKKNMATNGMVSGTANDGWIILDLGNIIVHLFIPDVREVYKLEELFNPKKSTKTTTKKSTATKPVVKKSTKSTSTTTTKKTETKKTSNIKSTTKKIQDKTSTKTSKSTIKIATKKPTSKKTTIKKTLTSKK